MSGAMVAAWRVRMRGARSAACALALGLMAAMAGAAPPPASPQGEIDHLLAYVQFSGCEFGRTGSWHTATDAEAHLREKLAMQNRSKPVLTAEDFLERVATRSAITGTAYQLRCPGGVAMPAGDWLGAELRRFRQCRLEREPCTPLGQPAAAAR